MVEVEVQAQAKAVMAVPVHLAGEEGEQMVWYVRAF